MARFTLTPRQESIFRQLISEELRSATDPDDKVYQLLQLTDAELKAGVRMRLDQKAAEQQALIDTGIDSAATTQKAKLTADNADLADLRTVL